MAKLYGSNVRKKIASNVSNANSRLSVMPRIGTIEEELADEDGEFRRLHVYKNFKFIYEVLENDDVLVIAVVYEQTPTKYIKSHI